MFVTPGMTDRKLGPTGSTTRRFVDLSRFGGPARRVRPEDIVEDQQAPRTPVQTRELPCSMWYTSHRLTHIASPPRHHAVAPVTPQAQSQSQVQAGPSRSPTFNVEPGPEPEPEAGPRFVHRRSPPMVKRHGKEPALPEVVEHLEPEHSRNRASGSPTALNSRERDPYRSRPPPILQEEAPRTHSRYESRTELPAPLPRPVETRLPDFPPAPPVSSYHTTPPRAVFQPAAPAPQPIQSEVRQYTQTAPLPQAIEPTRQTAPAPPHTQSQLDNNKRGFIVSHLSPLRIYHLS